MLSKGLILTYIMVICLSKSNLLGKYSGSCHKDEYWQIKLKADSTYKQISPNPGSNKTEGTWRVKADTLVLNVKVVNSMPINDSILKNEDVFNRVRWFTKYLIKKDTLVLLMNRNGYPIRKWCKLVK